VQGAAGALESLGRTIGPVWGYGLMQWYGEGAAYASAGLVLLGTAGIGATYRARAKGGSGGGGGNGFLERSNEAHEGSEGRSSGPATRRPQAGA